MSTATKTLYTLRMKVNILSEYQNTRKNKENNIQQLNVYHLDVNNIFLVVIFCFLRTTINTTRLDFFCIIQLS